MIKGEFSEAFGEIGRRRKHRQMRRIEEYEKFLRKKTIKILKKSFFTLFFIFKNSCKREEVKNQNMC